MTKVCDYCGKECRPTKEVRGTLDDWFFDGSYYHIRCLPTPPPLPWGRQLNSTQPLEKTDD
tara:strand:- start:419 stop:601 length:183 start_codon:yes stop_codon:yes gene_type:complete